jgi:hypothetical protein
MKPLLNRGPAVARPHTQTEGTRRPSQTRRLAASLLTAALLAFLVWPYVTVWRLDLATRSPDLAQLADLVDLESVRDEIKKKLNKDSTSTIDTLSDPFLGWIDEGIRSMGIQAVDRLVTLEWVRERLLAHGEATQGGGFLRQLTYAFFDSPAGFRLRIGPASDHPVHVRLRLKELSWRVEALYH